MLFAADRMARGELAPMTPGHGSCSPGRPSGASPAPLPLFVLGTPRSGTTWLANLLISHPDIVGLAAAEHFGIHESHLLDHTRYALAGDMSCDAFVDRYRTEDYFVLAGVSREDLVAASPARGDAVAFFAVLMETVARRTGARYWLEKTPKHAIYSDVLVERFPSARFVIITRSFVNTMGSQLAKFSNPRARWLRQRLEKAFRYEADLRAIRRLRKRLPDRVVSVTYENLLRDPVVQTDRVLQFLGLPERPLRSAYPPDSSEASPTARSALSWRDRAALTMGRAAWRLVPFVALRLLTEQRDRREAQTFPKYQRLATGGQHRETHRSI